MWYCVLASAFSKINIVLVLYLDLNKILHGILCSVFEYFITHRFFFTMNTC